MNPGFLCNRGSGALFLVLVLCAALLCACTGGVLMRLLSPADAPAIVPVSGDIAGSVDVLALVDTVAELARIAEIERAGGYFPGLGLAESGLREKAGDFAGAAVAAYKELSWAFACGAATGEQIEEGLQKALALIDSYCAAEPRMCSGAAAIRGCMAFARGDWALAEELLAPVLEARADEEPDSFLGWMLFVCALERNDKGVKERAARSAYGAIRARYALFPEYWYRGARAFSAERAGDGGRNIVYAEQCINTSPQGPFADDCRRMLGNFFGLSSNGKESASDLRTKSEIENIIHASVSMNDPKKLEELFPLMALPDNPYTLYALGAMQTLSSVYEFRAFFAEAALKSPGRLGERLNFISRN